MIHWLDETSPPMFPPTRLSLTDPSGLLAAGGALSPSWLHLAYTNGIFPWYSDGDPILWWSPAPRAVISPDSYRIPRSVRKLINKGVFTVTANLAFTNVIRSCQENRTDEGEETWINDHMIREYSRLNRAGLAVSIEAWTADGDLCGGFYGIRLGRAFFGESMFSNVSGASKVAFAVAAPKFFEAGISMIDCQMHTEHMARFGIEEINREIFELRLRNATDNTDSAKFMLPTMLQSSELQGSSS